MNYDSAYLWEKGSNEKQSRVALVLQQALVCKREVMLACVCESKNEGEHGVIESGYFTEGLTEWFHKELLRICQKKNGEEELKKTLYKEIERLQKEIETYMRRHNKNFQLHYVGMVLWKNSFWLFKRGLSKGYVLNKRFNQKNIKLLQYTQEVSKVVLFQGQVQKRLGILLCTSNYLSFIKKTEAEEVLIMEDAYTEERLQKRLQELWQENVKRGESASSGAIYIRT